MGNPLNLVRICNNDLHSLRELISVIDKPNLFNCMKFYWHDPDEYSVICQIMFNPIAVGYINTTYTDKGDIVLNPISKLVNNPDSIKIADAIDVTTLQERSD